MTRSKMDSCMNGARWRFGQQHPIGLCAQYRIQPDSNADALQLAEE